MHTLSADSAQGRIEKRRLLRRMPNALGRATIIESGQRRSFQGLVEEHRKENWE